MKVELVSKTVGTGKYKDLNQEEIIAAIARHGKIKNDNGKLVKYLMDNKHWSPLQHISFGFKIQTSRAISAQIFRHRSLNGQEWCITGDSDITMIQPSGRTEKVPIEKLYKRWKGKYKNRSNWYARVWDRKTNTFVRSKIKKVINTGIKKVYEVTLDGGKTIRSTKNHKFLTYDIKSKEHKFKRLEDCEPNKTFIAINGVPSYQNKDILESAKKEALNLGKGVQYIADKFGISYHTVRKWLKKNNITFTKKETASTFKVWDKGLPKEKQPNFGKTISNEIRNKMSKKAMESNRWSYKKNNTIRGFRKEVGDYWYKRQNKLYKEKGKKCALCGGKTNKLKIDHIKQVSKYPELAYKKSNIQLLCYDCENEKTCKERNAHLSPHYAQLIKIVEIGEEQTYDLEIEHESHNYVANNIVVHNSQRYSEPMGFEDIELRKEHPTNRQSSTEVFNPSIPDYIESGHIKDANIVVNFLLKKIETIYHSLLRAGVAKECARMILPMATSTTIHITATFRDLLGFLNVRCDHHAQKEVRDIATAIGEELEKEMPNIMKNIEWRNGMFM